MKQLQIKRQPRKSGNDDLDLRTPSGKKLPY